MEENRYIKAALNYQNLLDTIQLEHKGCLINSANNLVITRFKKKYNRLFLTDRQQIVVDDLRKILNYLRDDIKDISIGNNIYEWILIVKDFADFIDFSSKVFFFDKEKKEGSVYIEDMEFADGIAIVFRPTGINATITISYETTTINVPVSSNIVSDYISGIHRDDKVIFNNITIEKSGCYENYEEYKFVIDGSSTRVDIIDKNNILESVRHIVSKMIYECFCDIMNNNVAKISYFENKIEIEDFVNNELYFWRSK